MYTIIQQLIQYTQTMKERYQLAREELSILFTKMLYLLLKKLTI